MVSNFSSNRLRVEHIKSYQESLLVDDFVKHLLYLQRFVEFIDVGLVGFLGFVHGGDEGFEQSGLGLMNLVETLLGLARVSFTDHLESEFVAGYAIQIAGDAWQTRFETVVQLDQLKEFLFVSLLIGQLRCHKRCL